MKRKLLLSLCFLAFGFVQAQFTAIPDENFEQALIDEGIDTNMTRDGQVLTSAIESVTFLNLTGDLNFNVNQNEIGLNIQNLEGIKGFTSLEILWAQGNELTSLDLEGMSTLTDVRAFFNNLTSINISGLTNLQIIGLNENNIVGINLDSNTSLTQLDITGNALKGLDIRNNAVLANMTINGNPNLSCVLVTDVNAANANAGFVKDAATSYSETCPGLYTNIPDTIFEQYLIDENIDSEWGTPNGKILTADIVNVPTLELANLGISSLAGIEGFTSLERLVATNNNISTIDISNNLLLEHVGLQENQLSDLNVAQNTELIHLDVARNIGMTTINISQNIKLEVFFGFLSSFQTLDISQNTALINLGMSDNQLSEIDLSQNNSLETIFLDNNNLTALDVSNLPVNQVSKLYTCNNNITCISVSDVTAAETKTSGTCPERPTQPDGWHKDNTTSYNLDCTAQDKIVAITVASNQTLDGANNYVVTSANEPIQIAFNLEDENGVELTTTDLASYNIIVNTLEATNQNPAQGGNINTPGIDFELITNEEIQLNTANNGSDGTRTVNMNGDSLFEADEFFFVEVSTTDPNITLKNAVNGVVRIPVKIVDNEVTNVSLEVVENGVEGSQNVTLRINSSLANDTGADMPFTISLQDGSATEGSDFELSNTTVLLPDGQSSVDVEITVLTDQDATEGTEDFTATVAYSGTIDANRINITTATVTPTIADAVGGGAFEVSTSLGGEVIEVSGTACCPEYEIEEGQLLEITFDADVTATLGEEYIVQVSFANGEATEADVSVRENSPNFQYTYSVKTASPDNTLQIDIVDDFIDEPNGENLKITLIPVGSNYTFSGTTVFNVTIVDKTTSQPFEVSADVTGAGTPTNYTIEEGNSFSLNFDTGATGSNGTTYNPIIEITKDGVEINEDFTIDDLDKIFTIDLSNPDGNIQFTATDDGIEESDEIYTITIRTEDPNKYTITNPISFDIIIRDKPANNSNFNVNVTLGGDVINVGTEENPSYQINEGGTLLFSLEASNGATYDQQYFFNYSDNQNDLSTDFERNFEYFEEELQLLAFTPDESKNPDNSYALNILTDEAVDENEKIIQLTFYSESIDYTFNNIQGFNPLEFRIKIIDIDNTTSSSIFAAFNNLGGTEGGTDTFTVSLTEGGEEWLNTTGADIIFPVVFSNTRLNGSEIDLAESGDYNPINGNITIAPNSSTGSLEINLVKDSDQDHEYYVATLQNPISSTPISISTRAIEAKIIDQDSPFIINANVLGISVDFSEGACCPKYFVEEGDLIEIELEAEKGVDFNTPFFLQVTYGGSATENIDYKNRDTRAGTSEAPENTFEFSVKPKTPDNTIEIQILPDNLNENENFSFQIVSAESSKYIFSEFWTMSIVDAVPIKIESTVSSASESPTASGELTVSLSSGQPIDRSLSILYELDINSTASIEDFEPVQGSIEIPQGQTEATINITPIDDDIVETTESVIIKLVDDTGYAIEEPGVASVNIQSEDIAPVTATIIAVDNQASESNINNTGEFQISLDRINPNNEDTAIDFQFLTNQTNDALSNEYNLLDNNLEPLNDLNTVFIPAGESTTRIFVQAIDDDLEENDENVRIQLSPGVGYNIGSPNSATIEIVSSTFDENNFDVKSVRVTAQSAICASKDEGGILVENSSGFRFSVLVEKENDENIKREQNLEGNSNITFDELPTGVYLVTLENLTNPELNTPSFTIQIQRQEAISAEVNGVDLNLKTGNITVSGSTKYTVTSNSKTYDFNFDTIATQTLSIPLENGLNSISIEGTATCQGKISEQIMVEESYVYPNPTQDIITILGFNSGDQVYVKIFNPAGGIVLEEQKVMLENQLKISLLNLQTGLYLGQIKTDNGRQVTFKIIKENK